MENISILEVLFWIFALFMAWQVLIIVIEAIRHEIKIWIINRDIRRADKKYKSAREKFK